MRVFSSLPPIVDSRIRFIDLLKSIADNMIFSVNLFGNILFDKGMKKTHSLIAIRDIFTIESNFINLYLDKFQFTICFLI